VSGSGDDRTGVGVGQADLERVGHELREQGLGNGAQLENAQEGEVEIRHAIEEETYSVASDDAQIRQRCRPDVAVPAQGIEGEVLAQPAVVLPNKGQASTMALLAQPIGEQGSKVERFSGRKAERQPKGTSFVGWRAAAGRRRDDKRRLGVVHGSLRTIARARWLVGDG
jgi:hypothetical protein